MSGGKSELTVAGVLLTKHAGDGIRSDRRWHFYRATIEGTGVTFRPGLRRGVPVEWRAYSGEGRAEALIGIGTTLRLAVRRAQYVLGERAKR